MAPLVDAIRASRAAVAEFRDAMRLVNDPDMHEAAAPVVETADSVLAQHEQRVEPTIADDAANLRALFSHLPVPRADADLGPLPGLKALRSARGVLYQEFDEVLRSARGLGWRPNEPGLPDIVGAESGKDQGLERMLRTLVARMEAVEQLLERSVKPEGVPAPGRTTIQIALVQVFIKSMKIELALAKLEARVKATVDFSVLRPRRGKHRRIDDGFPRDCARHREQDDAGPARSERAAAAPGSPGRERFQDGGREIASGFVASSAR